MYIYSIIGLYNYACSLRRKQLNVRPVSIRLTSDLISRNISTLYHSHCKK